MQPEKSSDLNENFNEIPYLKMRDEYFSNAKDALKRKEFRKASELLWGAVTQSIKALASLSSIHWTERGKFFDYTRSIAKETGDKEYHTLFLELNSLHKNFYDEEIPSIDFPIFYEKALLFLGKTEDLIRKRMESGPR